MTIEQSFYLARRHDGLHAVVRIVKKGSYQEDYGATSKVVDRIIGSKNLVALLKAIRPLAPLMPKQFANSGRKRYYRIGDIGSDPLERLELHPADYSTLMEELVLETSYVQKSHVATTLTACKSFDIEICGFLDALHSFSPDDFVVVEPLQEFLFLRNSLSLFARIIHARQKMPVADSILEYVGFKYIKANKKMKTAIYAIPLQFNTWFTSETTPQNIFQSFTSGAEKDCPLLWRTFIKSYVGSDESFVKQFLSGRAHFVLKDAPDILILTAAQATGMLAPLIHNQECADKRLYLAIEENGRSQLELTEHLITSFISSFIIPNLSINAQSVFDGKETYRPIFNNLAVACWNILIDHPGYEIIECKGCKGAVFASAKGRHREFCSNACLKAVGRG